MDGIASPGLQEPDDRLVDVDKGRAKARLPIELSNKPAANIARAEMYCLTVQTPNPLWFVIEVPGKVG